MDDDVRMEVATDTTSGGATTLHAPALETSAAGPSARVRPRVTNGGGGKAGDHDEDVGEGAERETLSSCGKRTAMEEADIYGAMDATSRVGESFGTLSGLYALACRKEAGPRGSRTEEQG